MIVPAWDKLGPSVGFEELTGWSPILKFSRKLVMLVEEGSAPNFLAGAVPNTKFHRLLACKWPITCLICSPFCKSKTYHCSQRTGLFLF